MAFGAAGRGPGEDRSPVRRRDGGSFRGRLAAGALGLFVIVVAAIVALFALYYANLQHHRSTLSLRALEHAAAAATDAQVAFKLQVQEWKNSLLRGRDRDDYERYIAAMEARSGELRRVLSDLADSEQADASVSRRIESILEAHDEMLAGYREARARFEAGDRSDPWSADSRVRGIDRPIDGALDELAAHFREQAEAAFAANLAEAEQRHQDLRRAVLIANGLGILLLLVPLLGSLRSARVQR